MNTETGKELPYYIRRATELGLLAVQDGKLVAVNRPAVEGAMQVARIVDKLQPTSVQEIEDTTPQEAIVLSKVLASPSAVAREHWGEMRSAFGVGHGQSVPHSLWSDMRFRAIANEIDLTFIGQNSNQLISRDSLIASYSMREDGSRLVSVIDFNQAIRELSDPHLMDCYGYGESEWATALDVLKQFRVRALYLETLQVAKQNIKAEGTLEQALEFLQKRAMEGVGMIRGSIGSQGQAVDVIETIIGSPGDRRMNWIDSLDQATRKKKPVSTGLAALDLDIGGGVARDELNVPSEGRMFTFAARTGTGKTTIATHVATSLALGGLTVGFLSAELGPRAIEARLFASISRKTLGSGGYHWTSTNDRLGYITVTELLNPEQSRTQGVATVLAHVASALQESGGRLLVEAPWGACVDAVVNSMRSMKARRPELRAVVIDHFHSLARHKGAPQNDSAMLEDRAYRLMGAAKELGIDLFVIAQTNQIGIKAEAHVKDPDALPPPTPDEIRGTDALNHVSHAVWITRKQKQRVGEPTDRRLEIWHSKAREGQVFWESSGDEDRARAVVGGEVHKSIVQMDYSTCSLKSDDTSRHPLIMRQGKIRT